MGFNSSLYVPFDELTIAMSRKHWPDGFDTTDNPDLIRTLADLKHRVRHDGRLTVWSGACENSIYCDPRVNWHARAWHDAVHLLLNAEFDTAGETRVMRFQQQQVCRAVQRPIVRKRCCLLLECEIAGQLEHLERTGRFPENQREFAARWLTERGFCNV